jgi:hypothetical protein
MKRIVEMPTIDPAPIPTNEQGLPKTTH